MNSARYLPRRFASWYVLFTFPSPDSCILLLGLRISFVIPRTFSIELRYAERFHCSAKCCFFSLANASKIGILVPFPITNDVIMTSVLLLKGQVHGSVHAH